MKAEERQKIDRRLARVEGQVRGIRRLLSEEAYCIDILNQLTAAKAALDQTAASLVLQHVQHCIHQDDHAHDGSKKMSQEELYKELELVLGKLAK